MRLITGTVKCDPPKALKQDMNRTTKKNPPSSTDIKIILSNYDEYQSSLAVKGSSNSIFDDLIPSPSEQGHVYIGFPTHQTTGYSIHVK